MGDAGLWTTDWFLGGVVAACLLAVAYWLAVASRKRRQRQSSAPSAEPNRMLALACQGQGQLDKAFAIFRQCPVDQGLLEDLYSLALDYERGREFGKAETVFRYMAAFSTDFRDLQQRLARASRLAGTALAGGEPGRKALGKLMFGRYVADRELGKGAMGVVYLGHDSGSGAPVAIKTLALADEFPADKLADARARFLSEAETAERLHHPDIVVVYGAGEEDQVAYIAMEFLAGHDLSHHIQDGQRLPLPQVIAIAARVAEALDYAHCQQVVHRDIKPANIMVEPGAGLVKVMDFGIAGITGAGWTRSGAVLGTPAFMSPEQLAGKDVDGRTDLYSLGITVFQLCTGQVPFVGDSLAQLMYRIANEPAPDLDAVDPALPADLAAVVARCLAKDPDHRYQHGAELAHDLRACIGARTGTMTTVSRNATPQG